MSRRWHIFAALGLLIVTLSGCSALGSCPSRPANATPDSGTLTTDPVAIATDKSVYAPGDVVHIVFTDHLSIPIRVTAKRASCPLVTMEHLQDTIGQDVPVCGAAPSGDAGAAPESVYVFPQDSNAANLARDNAADQSDHPSFPSGTYRVVLHYVTTSPDGAIIGPRDGYIEYSAMFRICSCGVCT